MTQEPSNAISLALSAGRNLTRRLDSLRKALESGEDGLALELAREITGAKVDHGHASCRAA